METALGFFRLELGWVSRGSGRTAGAACAYQRGNSNCALAAAAYQAGARYTIDAALRRVIEAEGGTLDTEAYDHSDKSVHSVDLLLPEGAPDWCRDAQRLWTRLELSNRRKNATLALKLKISLPRDTPLAVSIRHLKACLERVFVQRGLAVDLAVHAYGTPVDLSIPAVADRQLYVIEPHWPVFTVARVPDHPPIETPHVLGLPDGKVVSYQPHAHGLVTFAPVVGHGFGRNLQELRSRKFLRALRRAWEGDLNAALSEAGASYRVDCRDGQPKKIPPPPRARARSTQC